MKNGWILALALLAPSLAAAQQIRINAGGTYASPSDLSDTYSQSGGEVGYHFGGDVRFGQFFTIAPGFHWQQLRFSLKDDAGTSTGISLSGIQVPVLFGLGIDLKVVDARIQAGPTVTFLTSVGSNDLLLEKSDFKSTSFGGQIGAAVDVLMVTIDLSYEFPFTQLFSAETPYGKGKLGVTRVGLGVKF
jgi:hypothetical protein